MIIKQIEDMGVRSHVMYMAGIGSIAAALAVWAASQQFEPGGQERADRWGIFIGLWAPTFLALGNALRLEEERAGEAPESPDGQRTGVRQRMAGMAAGQ
jgi:hypothetical protein